MVGIKVDQGTEPFAESPDELITKGLIGLPERLAQFKKKLIRISPNGVRSSLLMEIDFQRLERFLKTLVVLQATRAWSKKRVWCR